MTTRVKVAIAGIGNNVSALVQGVYYYRALKTRQPDASLPGIRRPIIDGLGVDDVEFVAGFDVAESKVGKDVSAAIFATLNRVHMMPFGYVPHMGDGKVAHVNIEGIGWAGTPVSLDLKPQGSRLERRCRCHRRPDSFRRKCTALVSRWLRRRSRGPAEVSAWDTGLTRGRPRPGAVE